MSAGVSDKQNFRQINIVIESFESCCVSELQTVSAKQIMRAWTKEGWHKYFHFSTQMSVHLPSALISRFSPDVNVGKLVRMNPEWMWTPQHGQINQAWKDLGAECRKTFPHLCWKTPQKISSGKIHSDNVFVTTKTHNRKTQLDHLKRPTLQFQCFRCMMKSVRRITLELLLQLAVVVGSLWIVMQVTRHRSAWSPSNIFNSGWLDYIDNNGGPDSACDCFSVLRGDALEIGKAKILTITKEFRKRSQVPDEFYINVTQNCRFDFEFCSLHCRPSDQVAKTLTVVGNNTDSTQVDGESILSANW